MEISNVQIARQLKQIGAVYSLKKGDFFKARAYETAADSIEHSTSEVKDLWEEGSLDKIPGVGEGLKEHLEDLLKTGKVKHWEKLKEAYPKAFFELLDIPGVGPKTALKLADLGVGSTEDLKNKIKSGELVKRGFSGKIAQKVLMAAEQAAQAKEKRMLLPYAFAQAERVVEYLKKSPKVKDVHSLGSLRRMVATIGDLDFSICSDSPQEVIDHIVKMPGVARVVEKGERSATVVLFSGLHLDFLIAESERYGALLHHFTGSKNHNIHIRKLAEEKGLSVSEYGVKNKKSGKIHSTKTEVELYKLLGMDTPPPELREDTGEIEAALKHQLPDLIDYGKIKGDLHLHSNYPLEPSHGPGADTIEDIAQNGKKMGYGYIGISDHPPSVSNHTNDKIISMIKGRTIHIDQLNSSNKYPRVLNLLEVDIQPNGTLSVPDEGLKLLDFAIAGIHSAHRQSKEEMTRRILKALKSPYVKIFVHPTGRLLNERDSYDADWKEIFKFVIENNKILEINAYPNRLDLPDTLVREAKSYGVKFVISTDSHELSQMENIKFGIAVARRGWLESKEVINTWDLKKVKNYFKID